MQSGQTNGAERHRQGRAETDRPLDLKLSPRRCFLRIKSSLSILVFGATHGLPTASSSNSVRGTSHYYYACCCVLVVGAAAVCCCCCPCWLLLLFLLLLLLLPSCCRSSYWCCCCCCCYLQPSGTIRLAGVLKEINSNAVCTL